MKNRKLLKTLEKEIILFSAINANLNARAFINRIFGYLRANKDLLQEENHKKLYDECLIILKWIYRKDVKGKNPQEVFEIVTDIMVKNQSYGCEKELFDKYLKYRIDAWSSGYYDKLFE